MKPEEISTHLEGIIEDPASEKAKKRAFYARIGGMILAAALSATSPVDTKAKAPEPDKVVNIDIPEPVSLNRIDPIPPSAKEGIIEDEVAQVATVAIGTQTVSTPVDIPAAIGTQVVSTPVSPKKRIPKWNGEILDSENGHINGPTGDETYYNLPMHNVVDRMHRMGVEGEYWVREDGVKMLGDYVIVAADLNVHPRGSIVETSLGTGIVCDTGKFAQKHHQRLDIATNWE